MSHLFWWSLALRPWYLKIIVPYLNTSHLKKHPSLILNHHLKLSQFIFILILIFIIIIIHIHIHIHIQSQDIPIPSFRAALALQSHRISRHVLPLRGSPIGGGDDGTRHTGGGSPCVLGRLRPKLNGDFTNKHGELTKNGWLKQQNRDGI